MADPRSYFGRIAIILLIVGAAAGAGGEDLVTGQLEIRGAVLRVLPERQEVAPGLSTVVLTALGQLEPGQIPAGLRVEGDLSGPGLDEPLRLTTTPGDVFRIPGLNREGTYTLSGIRLVEGDRTISAADPDSVEILVHRLVISSITSRALTPDEMDAYGIVIDADNYTAWHYSVGFQIEGGTVEVPFDLMLGPQGITLLDSPNAYALPVPNPDFPEVPVPTVNTGALEPIPRTGMPDLEERDIEILASTPIPGFIIIPSDIAFLNQFFSVIMVVQNGALAGSGLELSDLTGVLELSGDGLRQAETDPPTIPGEPVPVLDPGPDGEPGTSDDLMFIVAQASGQATWLVEGLREGQHRLTAHLTGEIHGLASGIPVPVEGKIPGVVVVRDPRFALTFFHPNTVRTGEFYDFRVSVTNTSTTPVYDLSLELPPNSISGARLLEADDDDYDEIEEGDNDPVQGVAELLPGTTGMVTWRLESRRTGRVVASAFNTSSPLDASFVFEIGVGELGIPLSPETIVLPPVVDDLPAAVVEPALELLGLAHSLANAPNGVEVDLPPVGETIVMLRGTELAAAGQRHAFGEPVARSVVGLGFDWMGASHWSSSFDVLRRQSRRGHALENATAFHLAERMEEIGSEEALAEVEELAISGRPMVLVFAEGAGFGGNARLALVGNISGHSAIGQRADVEFFSRELEGAAILGVDADSWSGEIGVIAVPIEEEGDWLEGSYQVQLWGTMPGSVNLEVALVMPDGGTRRFEPWQAVETGDGGLAFLSVGPEMTTTSIYSDSNGDTIQDWWEQIDVVVRSAPPASVITAGFNHTINPVRSGPYRNIVLLLSQPVDGDALASVDAADWFVESELEIANGEGGSESFARDRHGRSFRLQLDPRILIATFEEPLNPHAELHLSSGSSPLPLVGGGTLEIIDQPISAGGGLESGVVRGVVLGPDGGPLAHAIVEIYELFEICHALEGCNWYPSLSDRVSADAAGGFLFDAVRYRDETIPSQYAAFTLRAVDPGTGHEARLVARLPGDNQVRSLTLAMVGRGDVVGTLRRVDGSPLDDPLVIARSISNPTEGAQAMPDASGNFRLEDLPVGPVQVMARDGQAYTYATTQITAPGAEATVDLVLQEFSQPLAAVEGSVIDGETAEPVPGLDVYVIPAGFSGPTNVATTDSDGAFSMADVPPGVARFKAWSPNLGRYVGEVVSDLLGDSTNGVEMVLRPGATGAIVGTVTLAAIGSEEPVTGAYVVARDQGVFTLTDGEGRYELANLPLGRIRLETWDPVTAASTTREVDLTADGQVLVIDFVLREDRGLGSVTVNVADRNGVPEAGAEVAIGWFGSSYSGRTAGDGRLRIEEVPPGTHDVLVRLGGRLARGRVSVLYPGHAAQASIILGWLRNATITVVGDTTGDGSSTPLTPISYRVPGVTSNGAIGQLPEEGWTDCELEDDHSCRVENLPTNVGSLVAVASSGFYGRVTASRWIDDGGDHELVINFQAPGVVGGRIVRPGPDGVEAVEGAVVELWTRVTAGLIPQSQFTTRDDGVFLFDLVPLGEYSLRAYHPSFGVQWLNGRVSAGQVIDDLELRLRGRASIEGEVALCFEKAFAKAGSQVRVSLRPYGVPRPFISDLEIEDFTDGVLDVTLGEDERASFLFANRMVGGWTLTATSALHGSAYEPVSLGPSGETTTLIEPLCLHPTGSVTGQVSFPETGEPAPSATVQLFRRVSWYFEYLVTETTGDEGAYAFANIPVGRDYQVRAFDAASNRGGISATARLCDTSDPGYGETCGRDAVLDVSLSPMGRLVGVLRDQYEVGVGSAQIRLRTSVVLNQNGTVQSFQREWTTFSAADGGYTFDGVPAGTALVTAFDPNSPLFVEKSISVDPVGSPTVVADLELPPTAEVAVRVIDPFGADVEGGDPVVVFRQSSQSKFREPSGSSPRVEHLSIEATPTFAGVVADRFEVGACFGGCSSVGVDQVLAHQFNSALGAVAERWMSNPPSDQVVELELAGRAAVAVMVTQSGAPVAEAVVRIVGGGFYGTRDVSTQTGVDGAIFPIGGLGIGSYTVTASWSGLGGSREFEITQADHDGSIDLAVAIEASSSAAGRVVDPEGQPKEGALIKMIFGSRTFQTVSDGDGTFVFSALPIDQVYRLEAYAANGLGRHTLSNIVVGTEFVDLGELVLDETNPWVAGVAPANGAQDADTDVDVVIDFSELMRWGTLTGGRIKLREHGSGNLISTARTIEDQPDPDGEGPLVAFTRVTLTHGPLESEKLYLVDVLKTVEDLAGRSPSFDFHSTFRTRDSVPPEVLGVSPANDPDGLTPVGPDAVPIISFSESMDPESVDASTAQLLDSDDQLLETELDLQRDGFDIRIRPTTALELDAFYTIVIDGVTDAAGLPLAAPHTSTFRVRDIEPPFATLLHPVGAVVDGETWTALEGRPLTLRAAVDSNDALKTVVFTLGSVPVAAVLDASGEHRVEVTAPIGVPEAAISVQAEDVSGNLSAPVFHQIVLVDDEPPTGTLNTMPSGEIFPNHLLSISAEVLDDHGLRRAFLSTTGAIAQDWTVEISGNANQVTREVRVPAEAVAGSQIVVSCDVEDTLGQRVLLLPVTVTVGGDSQPPSVITAEPEAGSTFRAGQEVVFRFSLEDEVAVSSTALEIDGESVPLNIEAVVLPGTSWTWSAEATAVWIVPEIDEPVEFSWTMTAVDHAGNSTSATGTLVASPAQGPDDPVVSFVCPRSGDGFVPDLTMTIDFEIEDDDQIQHYSMWIDDLQVVADEPVNSDRLTDWYEWMTPSEAQPGDTVTVRITARDYAGNTGVAQIALICLGGTVLLDSQEITSDYVGEDLVLAASSFSATSTLRPASLTLLKGTTLTSNRRDLVEIVTEGQVVVSCGATIDVSGEGYWEGITYPGAALPSWGGSSGSHLGEGGFWGGTPGETFGSVYKPREVGAGGMGRGSGGGLVHIGAGEVSIDGTVRADGDNWGTYDTAGAGGSVWIEATSIAGVGSIQANGAHASPSGGGGAIALEYGSVEATILEGLNAKTGSLIEYGGAGSIYLLGPDSIFGDLIVDNAGIDGGWTVLPAFGAGTADAGSGGEVLVTDRAAEVFPFFVGHWVQIVEIDGEIKGVWRVVAVDGLAVTLEMGASVAVGDRWQGVYRFDSVSVRGNAKLYVPDLDDFASVVVDPGSVLELMNSEPPTTDLEKVTLIAYGGVFRVEGSVGAVSDPDGIASATITNETSDQTTRLNVRSDGSFSGIVDGSVGDLIVLELVDGHRDPRSSVTDLGSLPANADIPAIDPTRIQFLAKENSLGDLDSYLEGDVGAVLDFDQPVLVTATNLATGFSRQTTAAVDGNFSMTVRGTVGDLYELTVTDGHPMANTAVLDLGPLPDLFDPRIYPERITVSVRDRLYWLSSREPAFWDDGELAEAYAFDISQPDVTYPLEILEDFVLAPSPIPVRPGAIPQIVVVDGVGNRRAALLDPLPANDGPPIVRPEYVSATTANGNHLIENSGWCIWDKISISKGVSCILPIESYDGIENARFENRSTPGFGPFEFSAIEECPNCYMFDPVSVTGAVGDEIWLVVEDDHPDWLVAETLVWTLPPIPGAPQISLDPYQLGWVDNQYLLAVFESDITDPDEPLTFEVEVWRQVGDDWILVHTDSRSMASGEAVDVALTGGEQGDLVVASATDSTGLKTTVRVGYLPPPQPIYVRFQQDFVDGDENEGIITIRADLAGVPLTTVTVGWRTVAVTAEADVDYHHDEGVLTFPPGTRDDERIDIQIHIDSEPEDDETFRVELFNPVGAELGYPKEVEITIIDDDEITVVPYSVAVGALNFLDEPVDVSIVDGVASFAQPLPAVVGRGDRLEVEGLGSVFIDRCVDDSTCMVVDGLGQPPMDAYGVLVTVATAAFGSLSDAVDGAADADHLGTFDLVAVSRVLELVCYGSIEDTTPVVIDGWVTDEWNRIRIVAADVSYGHDGNWRHPGRWSGGAYRVEVDGTDCISTTIGNLTIEGLQLGCGAGPDVGVAGIRVSETAGSLEISETLIMLDGTAGAAQRAGIAISSSQALDVEVRNSILWDLGDPGNEFQTGILVEGPQVSLWAANNTIVGGGYGIHNLNGTSTAINNLVAGSGLASYEGDFELDSTLNLGSDSTAPAPPANAVGPVAVTNPVPSHDADFHLRCGVLDQPVTIGHDLEVGSEEDLLAVFDGNPDTLLRSAAINPARVRLDFGGQRAVTGTSVVLSHHDSHEWMVAAADSVADLEAQTGSYRELVSWRAVENEHLIWDGVTFDTPESFQVIELAVQRVGGDDYVHINEWSLDGLNPACGQGADLSASGGHAFVRDVDSVARAGDWDIGADQSNELTVGFLHGPHDWWEEEYTARIQVVLSEPAPAEVRVRYRTEALSADEGDDFQPAEGELVFSAGEFSKRITVDLENDGSNGDDGDSFAVILSDAVGARLVNDWWEIVLREGPEPLRVRLDEELIQANEADGVVTVWIRLNDDPPSNVTGTWDMVDGTAHIVADYRGMPHVNGAPWATYDIPDPWDEGSFEIELINDDVAEPVEGFLIKGGQPSGAELGVPSVGYVRITDDDGGSP